MVYPLTHRQKYAMVTQTMEEDTISTDAIKSLAVYLEGSYRSFSSGDMDDCEYSSINSDGRCAYCREKFPITEKHIISDLHTGCVHEFR